MSSNAHRRAVVAVRTRRSGREPRNLTLTQPSLENIHPGDRSEVFVLVDVRNHVTHYCTGTMDWFLCRWFGFGSRVRSWTVQIRCVLHSWSFITRTCQIFYPGCWPSWVVKRRQHHQGLRWGRGGGETVQFCTTEPTEVERWRADADP